MRALGVGLGAVQHRGPRRPRPGTAAPGQGRTTPRATESLGRSCRSNRGDVAQLVRLVTPVGDEGPRVGVDDHSRRDAALGRQIGQQSGRAADCPVPVAPLSWVRPRSDRTAASRPSFDRRRPPHQGRVLFADHVDPERQVGSVQQAGDPMRRHLRHPSVRQIDHPGLVVDAASSDHADKRGLSRPPKYGRVPGTRDRSPSRQAHMPGRTGPYGAARRRRGHADQHQYGQRPVGAITDLRNLMTGGGDDHGVDARTPARRSRVC